MRFGPVFKLVHYSLMKGLSRQLIYIGSIVLLLDDLSWGTRTVLREELMRYATIDVGSLCRGCEGVSYCHRHTGYESAGHSRRHGASSESIAMSVNLAIY